MEKYFSPFKEKKVKDGNEYSNGIYVNRVPVFGFYIDGDESLIKDLEIKSKGKFKLECDPENYAQEVRMHYYIMLDKYIEKFGNPKCDEDFSVMKKYVAKGCLNKLKDLSRKMKNKISYYDEEKEEFVILSLISLEGYKYGEFKEPLLDSLEYMICSQEVSNSGSHNEFGNWFNNNKGKLLTNKQLEYLKDSNTVSVKNKKTIEKNIVKRVDKEYSGLTIQDCKLIEMERRLGLIEEILDSGTGQELLIKITKVLDDELWLMEILYSMDLSICKLITDATKNIFTASKYIYTICDKLMQKSEKIEENIRKIEKNSKK